MSGESPVRMGPAICTSETDLAVLINITDFKEEVWIPKSCIHDDGKVIWPASDEETSK